MDPDFIESENSQLFSAIDEFLSEPIEASIFHGFDFDVQPESVPLLPTESDRSADSADFSIPTKQKNTTCRSPLSVANAILHKPALCFTKE